MTTPKFESLVFTLLMAYTVFYAFYMSFVALFTLGPEDFNGNPNPASANIVGGLLVAGSLAQVVIAFLLARQPSLKRVLLLLGVAYGALIVFVVHAGSRTILAALPPAVNCVLITFATLPYWLRRRGQ